MRTRGCFKHPLFCSRAILHFFSFGEPRREKNKKQKKPLSQPDFSISPQRLHVRFLIGCFDQPYLTASPDVRPSLQGFQIVTPHGASVEILTVTTAFLHPVRIFNPDIFGVRSFLYVALNFLPAAGNLVNSRHVVFACLCLSAKIGFNIKKTEQNQACVQQKSQSRPAVGTDFFIIRNTCAIQSLRPAILYPWGRAPVHADFV